MDRPQIIALFIIVIMIISSVAAIVLAF